MATLHNPAGPQRFGNSLEAQVQRIGLAPGAHVNDRVIVEPAAQRQAQVAEVGLGERIAEAVAESQKPPARADEARLAKYRGTEVLPARTNAVTGRPAAISDARLAALAGEVLPVAVSGDPVQYQVNRNATGWVVELVNHAGVAKKPDVRPRPIRSPLPA